MFLKTLTISSGLNIIREINFRKGINLIVDDSTGAITGNSVGKTTVLKLIDFCFGANQKIIYQDPESKKEIYKLVKDYLVSNDVIVKLVLTSDLDEDDAEELVIERNFLSNSKIKRIINGEFYTEDKFEPALASILFPDHKETKPTFRQIISHNIRYKDLSINNTLKTADVYTSDVEYEALHLFLFGCEFTKGNEKQILSEKIKLEEAFKKRLEKDQTRSAYESVLSIIEIEIEELDKKKANLNLNEDFEADLNNLNKLKYEINIVSSEISRLNIRKELILDTQKDLNNKVFEVDTSQLEQIYKQTVANISPITKSFDDLVQYHNKMIGEKVKYITKELPELSLKIIEKESYLNIKLEEEKNLSRVISKSDSFEELENLISKLTDKHRRKGEYENIINQLLGVEENIKELYKDLEGIEIEQFSNDFEIIVKAQLKKFNKHFSRISELLYGEKYAVKYDIIKRKGKRYYKFTAFNISMSSGKKQGEISCFDIAYILFAIEENISCLHFVLNDKKELMHNNQLVKIAEYVNSQDIQFVASILKDKLPDELNKEEYFILKLSEKNKLFKIE